MLKCEHCPVAGHCNFESTGFCLAADIDENIDFDDGSSYLYEFIFEACEYFSSAGYICNASESFSVISDVTGKMDIKRLLSTMLAHSYQEAAAFDTIYNEFVERYYHRHREERKAKTEHEENRKKINEKLQRLTGRQQELMQQREQGQKESKEIKKA